MSDKEPFKQTFGLSKDEYDELLRSKHRAKQRRKRKFVIALYAICAVFITSGVVLGFYSKPKSGGSSTYSNTSPQGDSKSTTTDSGAPATPAPGAGKNTQSTTKPSTSSVYIAPVCVTTPIPFKTIYKNVSYLAVGVTQQSGGEDGYTKTCTTDSTGYKPTDLTVQPYDKTVYVGVGSTTPPSQTYTYDQAYREAERRCTQLVNGQTGTGAYQQCLEAVMYQLGF